MVDLDALKNLPEDPGVYIMKDKNGTVIYVGKAKVLKNRVKQYFQNVKKHPKKVIAMVSRVDSFEYILTDSELEALILECNLIKKYKPYYNILLKDDKNYPYIKVTVNEPYPKLRFARRMERDGAKYFGPYTSAANVREVIDLTSKLFKIPTCEIHLPKDMGKKRACINAQIDRCCAPCENVIEKSDYAERIQKACRFLDGGASELIKELSGEMQKASEELAFERAAAIRDKLNAIREMEKQQKVVSGRLSNEDVIGFYNQENKTFVEVFFIRSGRLLGRHSTQITNTKDMLDTEVAESFIKQFYHNADFVPSAIYIQFKCDEETLLSAWLSEISGHAVKIHTPVKGAKKALVDMANKNAKQAALNHILKNAEGKKGIKRIILDLKQELNLPTPPCRIEAYDVSNTAGKDNVGSMVVFQNGEPLKRAYRRFKIETAMGGDDYNSMSEMILRRIEHARDEEKLIENGELTREKAKFLPLPDCIFLDGGKGHLSVISELLSLIDTDIPLFAMVKNDKHKTAMLLRSDGESVGLKPNSNEFRLVSSIQEEVHRFAIQYHRTLRSKNLKHSELEKISGVGEKSVQKLFVHFKNLKSIKTASVEELKQAGISQKCAENIFAFFRK